MKTKLSLGLKNYDYRHTAEAISHIKKLVAEWNADVKSKGGKQ